jgi:16S rRNA (cytosine967-C5)-methyltransferase
LLEALNPEWNKTVSLEINEKIKTVKQQYELDLAAIFPFKQHLSSAIEFGPFANSFLIQPDIYLRLRPGKEMIVKQKLSAAQIPFQLKNSQAVSVPPATKLDEILALNKEVVIQDLNSQKVLEPLLNEISGKKELKTAWDCCAASGGKSILLFDKLPGIQLTVSDIRGSTLINLKKRFSEAGINSYKKMVADISDKPLPLEKKFDLIICDAPCSGSGTWSRTPEQLYFFDEKRIQHYSTLQKRIVTNAVKNLRKGSCFLYITCSVFKKENEEIATFIKEKLMLRQVKAELLKGYDKKADTLYASLFTASAS